MLLLHHGCMNCATSRRKTTAPGSTLSLPTTSPTTKNEPSFSDNKKRPPFWVVFRVLFFHCGNCGKVTGFSTIFRKRPCPRTPGDAAFSGRGIRFRPAASFPSFSLKKEMKFLLTNEKLRSSSSSAGKNGKASRFSGEAVSPCLEAAASLSSARFRLYHIVFPAGQKVKSSLPQSLLKQIHRPERRWIVVFAALFNG